MEPIEAEDVRKCMKGAPAKAAVGSDQWRPHDWASLPEEGIHDIVKLMHEVEAKGRWPEQVLCNLVVFIGKPTPVPSERPISLTSGLYRLWCKLRKPLVEEWEGKACGFWDRAIAGSSALQAALARELRHEIAHHVGACTGGVYFDMAKFYDSLQVDIVLEKAASLGFPPLVLYLALMVHMAPRILRAGQEYSDPVYPASSILAGCGMSVAWTRAVLHQLLDEVHRRHRPTELSMESWVDDLTSVIQGSERSCVSVGVDAGLFIAAGAKRLGLTISPKSAVLFNRPGVAKQVSDQLREHGVIIQATTLTKDLGLGTTAAGRRRTVHQQQRRQKMCKRLVRIQGLVKQNRRCRAMVWIAAKPQGTWGHQANGLAPTTVKRLRQQFAGAAMLRRTGGCTTTAFGLTVGLSKDPTVGLRMELFGSWLEVAVNPSIPKQGLEKVWGQLRESLAGPRRWHQVRGPMGAVVATLMDLGWKPGSPTSWTDPDGIQWDIDPSAPGVAVQLKAVVAEFIEKDLWRQASQHEGGRGLENGADLTVARRMRRQFLKQGELKKAGILELICQGASWPPARKAAAGLPVDPTCTFCRLAPGTVKHQTWECTGLLKAIGEDRA
jgi:hypothetical protein